MTVLSACGKTNVKTGTLAAKLLLANERLDENLLNSDVDFGLSPTKVVTTSKKFNDDEIITTTANSERKYWSNFPAYSDSMVEFSQFVKSIEEQTMRVANEIVSMKDNVGVLDQWVESGNAKSRTSVKQLLRVYDNKDVLFTYDYTYNDIHAYYRYTDENAKNVYDMYSFSNFNDGSTGLIKTLCIPNERYEYMYIHSSGFKDFFIAENTRGYWMNTRFSYIEVEYHESATFFPYILKMV